jgi:hypothetical protein
MARPRAAATAPHTTLGALGPPVPAARDDDSGATRVRARVARPRVSRACAASAWGAAPRPCNSFHPSRRPRTSDWGQRFRSHLPRAQLTSHRGARDAEGGRERLTSSKTTPIGSCAVPSPVAAARAIPRTRARAMARRAVLALLLVAVVAASGLVGSRVRRGRGWQGGPGAPRAQDRAAAAPAAAGEGAHGAYAAVPGRRLRPRRAGRRAAVRGGARRSGAHAPSPRAAAAPVARHAARRDGPSPYAAPAAGRGGGGRHR